MSQWGADDGPKMDFVIAKAKVWKSVCIVLMSLAV